MNSSNQTIAAKLTANYSLPVRLFNLPKSKVGSNEWIFRRLVTNIIVGGTLEENALQASANIFKKYPDCKALAKANPSVLTEILQASSVRFAGRKAAYVIQTATNIVHQHKGIVPNNRKDLEKFTGVGRHVASIVLALAFAEPAFAVDLHVKRIAQRLGLVDKKDSDRVIEQKLTEGVDPENYGRYSRAFVDFGKEYCGATPNCSNCFMKAKCGKCESAPKTVTASAVKRADGVYEIVAGSSEIAYNVSIKAGTASCNCKGFRFRRTCSHVKEVMA